MPAERLLVVGPSWVGDMVMAQALFKTLAGRFPDADIDVVAPGWSVPIVARMPEIRRAVVLATAHGEFGLGKRRELAASLRPEGYTRAIVLPRSMKAALVPWLAGIPTRTGFRGEMRFGVINDIRPFDKALLDQTVKRFVALGLPPDELPTDIPQPVLRVDAARQRTLIDALGLPTGKPVVAMMPGAEYGPAKCWPLEHFASLARELAVRGFDVWLLGSDKDRAAGESIASASSALNLCGRTSLEDVIDVLALAQQVVSNDSGLMHVAAAVGCHVHGIYGSSSPAFTPPLTERRTIHHLDLDCSPCFKRECPLGHLNCLNTLDVSRILSAIGS
ncbi:MAG: lipopolysaccharide heptosyltransferase II [Pseudomonadota bacterium]